jgi:alginate O-acetyltransferase complex protein AlgJ
MQQGDQQDLVSAGAKAGAVGDLLPEHVEAVFLEFLGRTASPKDVAIWMEVGSLRALLDGVLASDEYAACLTRRSVEGDDRSGPFLNCWTPGLEAFSRPIGSLSPDGVAMVGENGHLFLCGGSNNNLAMYRGEVAMPSDWCAQWRRLVSERLAHAQARCRSMCCLVVPDKLAVYSDLFPQDLSLGGPRPVTRLIDESLPLLYPCEALCDARRTGDTYMLTDSHLTERGNRLLAEATIRALGLSPTLLECLSHQEEPRIMSGDLGQHFRPPIVELGQHLISSSLSRITADNWHEVSGAGGHIGTLRVFRRDDAPDQRTVVVFGDSYGFGDEAYRGLSWFLSQVFREVHFAWVPFGWDPDYLDMVGAEFVICQTAERFIARVPQLQVDVQSLAREAAGQGGALGLENVFGDAAPH